jgi:DNA repair exonuclease SbcCD ATPase subunit
MQDLRKLVAEKNEQLMHTPALQDFMKTLKGGAEAYILDLMQKNLGFVEEQILEKQAVVDKYEKREREFEASKERIVADIRQQLSEEFFKEVESRNERIRELEEAASRADPEEVQRLVREKRELEENLSDTRRLLEEQIRVQETLSREFEEEMEQRNKDEADRLQASIAEFVQQQEREMTIKHEQLLDAKKIHHEQKEKLETQCRTFQKIAQEQSKLAVDQKKDCDELRKRIADYEDEVVLKDRRIKELEAQPPPPAQDGPKVAELEKQITRLKRLVESNEEDIKHRDAQIKKLKEDLAEGT